MKKIIILGAMLLVSINLRASDGDRKREFARIQSDASTRYIFLTPEEHEYAWKDGQRQAVRDQAYLQGASTTHEELGQNTARTHIATQEYLNTHGYSARESAEKAAEASAYAQFKKDQILLKIGYSPEKLGQDSGKQIIARDTYIRNNTPFRAKLGEAVQHGIAGGVGKGVGEVIATAIIYSSSWLWETTTSPIKRWYSKDARLTHESEEILRKLQHAQLEELKLKTALATLKKQESNRTLAQELHAAQQKQRIEDEAKLVTNAQQAVVNPQPGFEENFAAYQTNSAADAATPAAPSA